MSVDLDPHAIDGGFVAQPSPDVFTVVVDGEAVLLDEREQRLHHLNAPATLVWSCLDGDATVAQLATELSEELDVERPRLVDEVLAIVRDLGAQGLLLGVRAGPREEGP